MCSKIGRHRAACFSFRLRKKSHSPRINDPLNPVAILEGICTPGRFKPFPLEGPWGFLGLSIFVPKFSEWQLIAAGVTPRHEALSDTSPVLMLPCVGGRCGRFRAVGGGDFGGIWGVDMENI